MSISRRTLLAGASITGARTVVGASPAAGAAPDMTNLASYISSISGVEKGEVEAALNHLLNGKQRATHPLGPSKARLVPGSAAGTFIAAITGLNVGERAVSVDPNTTLALSASGGALVSGVISASTGTINAKLFTTEGRTLVVSVAVAADVVGVNYQPDPLGWSSASLSKSAIVSADRQTATAIHVTRPDFFKNVYLGTAASVRSLKGSTLAYIEVSLTHLASNNVVLALSSQLLASGAAAAGAAYTVSISPDGSVYNGRASIGNIGALDEGAVICAAVNPKVGKGWFRKNTGQWNASGAANPETGVGGFNLPNWVNSSSDIYLVLQLFNVGDYVDINTGDSAYANLAPSGFGVLSVPDLAIPTFNGMVKPPVDGMNTLKWHDDFDGMSFRETSPDLLGTSATSAVALFNALAAGRGVWASTEYFAPDSRGCSYDLYQQRAFDVSSIYAWPGGYAGQVTAAGGNGRLRTQPTPKAIKSLLPINAAIGDNYDYVAVTLNTQHSVRFSVPFYVEARIKFPKGKGVWPAFWLLGSDHGPNGDPYQHVEFDIAEYFPNPTSDTDGSNAKKMNFAVHYSVPGVSGLKSASGSGLVQFTTDWSLDFHVYGLYLTSSNAQFYIDGSLVKSIAVPIDCDMRQSFYFIIDNGYCSADFVGIPDGTVTNENPRDMLVDYVRVWGDNKTAVQITI